MAKVLFIEDNPDWQNLVQQLLKTAGHEASSAKTFDTAIDILNSKQKFDVIVFDLALGDNIGHDPFVWLDALIQGSAVSKVEMPPVVIVTGVDVSKQQIIKAFTEYRDSVFCFFEKRDFDPKEFLQSIKRVTDYSPRKSTTPTSLRQLLTFALLMTAVVLITFGVLLWSLQQISDPKTQQLFYKLVEL